jgi:hypothetical protein
MVAFGRERSAWWAWSPSSGRQPQRDFALIAIIGAMDSPSGKRHRPPRAADNAMAQLAHRLLDEAVRLAGTADALAMQMEPHVGKRYGNSAIYAYTNARAVPPGDVLLAAALAAGISLDERLGLVRQQDEVERQVDDLRVEMAQLRTEVAALQGRLPERDDAPAETSSPPRVETARQAQRREWARRSMPAGPPIPPAPGDRAAGRNRRP